jgi:parallel beta-helix repeat protein
MKKTLQFGLVTMLVVASFIGMINLTSENAKGFTFVSGTISTDTTWDLAGSPYIIVGNVIVDSGVTLTVDPGVQVKFDDYYRIDVDGDFIALGNSANKINITSNKATPAQGDWYTIRVNPGGYVVLNFCNISYSLKAVQITSSSNNIIAWSEFFDNEDAVKLISSSGNHIRNNTFMSNGEAVGLFTPSNNNEITGNNFSDNWIGLYIEGSLNNIVTNNNFVNDGVYVVGSSAQNYNTHTIPTNNIVNGKPLYYYTDCNNLDIDGITIGELILANCANVNVENLQINNTYVGIEVALSTNINIMNNNISYNNRRGIHLFYSSYIDISNNIVTNNGDGISIWDSDNNIIENNDVLNNYDGVSLAASSLKNELRFNNISGNNNGVDIFGASYNNITYNNISDNTLGISSERISYNRIHHNNFIDNVGQAYDEMWSNFWNDTYPSGGNYWDNYSPTCQDLYDGSAVPQTGGSPDGICDDEFLIPILNADYYPLTNPAVIGPPPDTTPPTITDLMPIGQSLTDDNTPTIAADYTDSSGIDIGSVRLEVNGIDVTSSATVTASGVNYAPSSALPDGLVNVSLEVNDTAGNQATASWSFIIDTASPIITNEVPSQESVITDRRPTIGADYSDNIGIDLTRVLLKVDGENVTSSATVTATGITYVPTSELSEGVHTVILEVYDHVGNGGYMEWSFTVGPPTATGDFLSDYWWIIVVALVVVILIIVIFLFMRKKKREPSIQPPAEQERPPEVQNGASP